MKKLILILLLLQAACFADYRITQYYGVNGNYGDILSKEWITKELPRDLYSPNYNVVCVHFIDKTTGRNVYVSLPYSVEELEDKQNMRSK